MRRWHRGSPSCSRTQTGETTGLAAVSYFLTNQRQRGQEAAWTEMARQGRRSTCLCSLSTGQRGECLPEEGQRRARLGVARLGNYLIPWS